MSGIQGTAARRVGRFGEGAYLLALMICLGMWLVHPATAQVSSLPSPPGPLSTDSPGGYRNGPASPGDDLEGLRSLAPPIPGAYIVVLEDSVDHPGTVAEAQADQHDGDLGFVYRAALKGYSIKDLSKEDLKTLRRDPRVKYVQPDRRVEALEQKIPTGITRIQAAENPYLDIDGIDDARVNVDIAIIDTGIDHTHPDLNVVSRTDCTQKEGSCVNGTAADGSGHGTHVAGTAAAIDNGLGVVGVAPGARLWAVRVLDNEGYGYMSWVIAGINWVAERSSEIEVANMSIGGLPEPAENAAISAVVEKGVVFAAAASNESTNSESSTPGNSSDVITVSALADYDGKAGGAGTPTCTNWGADDGPAEFTNWGKGVEIAAPGVCIYSTVPGGGYGYKNGTSMASPHVAGAAAVLASKSNPQTKKDVEAIRQALIEGGSLNWRDTSEDGAHEPLLYLGTKPLEGNEAATGGWSTSGSDATTVYGSLNPRGTTTSYYFEYGTTTSYGKTSSAQKYTGGYTSVSAKLTGLERGQSYHYRLVSNNGGGQVVGADHLLNQSPWVAQEPVGKPLGIGTEWMNSVSCPVEFRCMAVGYRFAGGSSGISYERIGDEWVPRSIPTPAGAWYPEPISVSCVSVTACAVVGNMYMESSNSYVPFAARWNGSSWSTQSVPTPSGALYSVLLNVSCPTASECMAVGYYQNSEKVWVNYSALWNGSTWSTLKTPNPEGSGASELDGVSCPAANRCTAVGWWSGGGHKPQIATWDGVSWSFQTPARSSGYLQKISCTSATFCLAVGNNASESWDGSKWSSQSFAQPPGPVVTEWASDISCLTPSSCMAPANSWIGPRKFGFMQRWDGKSWQFQYPIRHSEARERIWGVSCVSSAGCTAVGEGMTEAPLGVVQAQLSLPKVSVLSFGSSGTGKGQLKRPLGMAVDNEGNVWVADSENNRVQKFNTKGEYLFQFGTSGSATGQLKGPSDIAITSGGDLWVVDGGNDRIQKFNTKGEYLTHFGSAGTGDGKFEGASGIAIGPNGNIWVTDFLYYRVSEFTASGGFVRTVGTIGSGPAQFDGPEGIAVDKSGNVWVADRGNNRVQKFSSTGTFLDQFGNAGEGNGQFSGPTVLDVLPSGRLLVTDRWTGRVQEFSSQGEYLAQFGAGKLTEPEGLAAGSDGSIYIANSWGNSVLKWLDPRAPKPSTGSATGVTETKATLNAAVNPNALATTYQFEYGTTTAYGSKAPASPESVGSGASDVAVSKQVEGLKSGTYHYRVVASNEMGTSYGEDKTFSTASISSQLSSMAVTEPFDGSSESVASFNANWAALGWASGATPKGENTASGWRPVAAYPTVNGAYYNSTVTDGGSGIASVVTMAVNPASASRYFSLWLDAGAPSGTRGGYELKFTNTSSNTYSVTLSKWQAGSQTVLASQSGYSFVNGNSLAVVDQGGTVSAWTNTGSGFNQLLSASDSSFSSGKAAVEGSGNVTRLTKFKAGSL